MPGFVGFYDRNEGEELLGKMSNSIMHENWYQVDSWLKSPVGISRVHLGTFNPQRQPATDGNIYLFLDGKIYDYSKDLHILRKKGYEFRANTDVNFCLCSFKEFGDDFVKRLNGIFTIVIYLRQENRIIIFNDRYGFRPFYYYHCDNRLIFSSEIKSILQYNKLQKEIDDKALFYMFRFGHLLGNETLFRNISVLPPASVLTFDGSKVMIAEYWTFKYAVDQKMNEEDIAQQLTDSLRKAVAVRMEDDLRYGISLSGGLDSRCVIGAIDKTKQIYAYTFGIKGSDETTVAKQVVTAAKKNNPLLRHKIIEISPTMLIDAAEEVMHLTEGMDIVSVAYLPFVLRKMRKLIDISISGFALDLLLGGSYLEKQLFSVRNDNDVINYVVSKMSTFSEENLRDLMTSKYYTKTREPVNSIVKEMLSEINEDHPANRTDIFFLQTHVRRFTLFGSVITRSQIEENVPTYDKHFMDLLLSIPPEMRFNYRLYRRFLKKLSPELTRIPYQKTMIPPYYPKFMWLLAKRALGAQHRLRRILWHYSKGNITIPYRHCYVDIEQWLRTNVRWRNFARETLLSKKTLSKTYFKSNYVRKLITEHETGMFDHTQKIVYLISFELFLRKFFN